MVKNFLAVIVALLFVAGCSTTGLFASYDKTGKYPLVTAEKLGDSLKTTKAGDILVLVENDPKSGRPKKENRYSVIAMDFAGDRAIVTVQGQGTFSYSIAQVKLAEYLASGGNIYFVRK